MWHQVQRFSSFVNRENILFEDNSNRKYFDFFDDRPNALPVGLQSRPCGTCCFLVSHTLSFRRTILFKSDRNLRRVGYTFSKDDASQRISYPFYDSVLPSRYVHRFEKSLQSSFKGSMSHVLKYYSSQTRFLRDTNRSPFIATDKFQSCALFATFPMDIAFYYY